MAIDPNSQGMNQAPQQIVQQVSQVLGKLDEATLQKFYQLAIQALQNPQMYPELLKQAIASGKVKPGELPDQYDEKMVKAIVIALQIAIEHKKGSFGGQQQPLKMPKSL